MKNSTGTASSSTSNSGTVTKEKAKSIALKDAGLSAKDVYFTKAEVDYDDSIKIYEIEFVTKTKEYEYEINAKTGKILEKSVERL